MKVRSLLVVLSLVAATAANAQDSTLTNNSSASANTSSGSLAQNEGVQNTIVQNSSPTMEYKGHFSETVNSQVPISTVGYGSFSQNSCMTSIGGGASTRMFSFVYNGPKADVNCQHVVQGDAFGRATQLAKQLGVDDMARASLALVFYAYCTSNNDYIKACIQRHLVVDAGTTHRVGKDTVADVLPASILPDGAEKYLAPRTAEATPAVTIPTHPQGWTHVAGQADSQGQQQATVNANDAVSQVNLPTATTYSGEHWAQGKQ